MGLFELRVLLVVILCVPIVLLGVKLIGSLTEAVLAGKKKSGPVRKSKETDER